MGLPQKRIVLALLAGCILASCDVRQAHQGNPLRDEPPATKEERQAIADDKQDRRVLADEVVRGEKGFAEAGCEYRGGVWNADRALCIRHFMARHDEPSATQASMLAERIQRLAAQSDDATPALSIGQAAAASYLNDHPEDFRAAAGAAIREVGKARLLSRLSADQRRHLNQLTDANLSPQ